MSGSQPSNKLVRGKNCDLLPESHNILNKWKEYFSLLSNAHSVIDIRQILIHTAELLLSIPVPFEVENSAS
jgi:hypothetical protein